MITRMHRRRFILYFVLFAALSLCGIFASPQSAYCFSFAVLSDPHAASDSWVNALTEVKDIKINPDPKFGKTEFILITGDTNPIDMRYGDFKLVFKDSTGRPDYLPVIGNHEADDNGGFPGGMGQGMGPQGQGGGQPGMGSMPQDMGGSGQGGGQPGQGGPQGAGGQQSGGGVVQMPGQRSGIYPDNGDASIIDMEFIRDKIIAVIPGAVRMSDKSCSYYYDKENVRVISLDGYSGEAGAGGVINDKGRTWTEKAITSAPANIEHIFIAFHAPAFPRGRHTNDSFNSNTEQRNAFWNMLVSHRDKVKAVFSGHTHVYCRMRVLDPAGTAANDYNAYPDEEGGIYQVVVGSTGNGMKNTFLRVEIDGKNVYFRAYEAENGKDQPFAVKEEWRMINK